MNLGVSVLQDFSKRVIFRNYRFAGKSCSQWTILHLFGCCYSFLSCRRAVTHFFMCWGADCSSSHATDTDNTSQLRGWGHLAILKSLLLALQLLFYFLLTHHSSWKVKDKISLIYRCKSPSVRSKESFRTVDRKGRKDWKMVSRDICVLRTSLTVGESNFNMMLLEG